MNISKHNNNVLLTGNDEAGKQGEWVTEQYWMDLDWPTKKERWSGPSHLAVYHTFDMA